METEVAMAGPGKDKFYTMAYVYCLFSEPTPPSSLPAPSWNVNSMRAGNFVCFINGYILNA